MSAVSFRERLLARAGLAGVSLAALSIDRLDAYFRLLNRWNKSINLTGLPLDPPTDQTIDRLLIEPLAAAKHLRDTAVDWFDLGSGGGSPAIPMKIVHPKVKLTLVEARSRKAAFLREVARELTLSDVRVLAERFQAIAGRPEFQQSADLITARAVRIDAALFTAAHLLARPGAELFLFGTKGTVQPASSLFEFSRTVELVPTGDSNLAIGVAI